MSAGPQLSQAGVEAMEKYKNTTLDVLRWPMWWLWWPMHSVSCMRLPQGISEQGGGERRKKKQQGLFVKDFPDPHISRLLAG
jgi:hypothetical protein